MVAFLVAILKRNTERENNVSGNLSTKKELREKDGMAGR